LTGIYEKIKSSEKPVIMGILNVTPDSFSDGGKFFDHGSAFEHAVSLINNGADIIDIGGESTRPGAESVEAEEEIRRVVPVIKKLHDEYPGTVISIDTTKSKVAAEAADNGASIINDISGGGFDKDMLPLAGEINLPFVIMHIKGTPRNMQNDPSYENVIDEINNYFKISIYRALDNKVEKIILDPGIGFGKRISDNYEIISRVSEFKKWDYPVMIGLSKKSFLGKSLNLDIEERANSTIITETISVLNGADIIRTHEVKNTAELKKIISHLNLNSITQDV